MNYVAALVLPPMVMFASVSIVEKLLSSRLSTLQIEQQHAVVSLLSRIFTIMLLLVVPFVLIVFNIVLHRELSGYWEDYCIGCLLTINVCFLCWNSYMNESRIPYHQIMLVYAFYYHLIHHHETLLYYSSLIIAFFSTLRIGDDLSLLFPSPRLIKINTVLRLTEEFGMYLFFIVNPSKMSMFAFVASVVVLPWIYSTEIKHHESMYFINRHTTTLPSIENSVKTFPLLLTAATTTAESKDN
jgi:hypothetical protein